MTTHKGRDAVASSPLWVVILEEPFNYFIVHLCTAVWKKFSCLPIMAVIKDMPIMKVHNGPVAFYQQQMLNLPKLARAVISDAR